MSLIPTGKGAPSQTIVRILLLQLGIGGALALAVLLLSGWSEAFGFLLGTLVGVIPNAYLGLRIVGFGPGTDARELLRAAWAGELGKLLLTVLLMAAVFAFVRPTHPGWFLLGFIAVQVSSWIALFVFRRA